MVPATIASPNTHRLNGAKCHGHKASLNGEGLPRPGKPGAENPEGRGAEEGRSAMSGYMGGPTTTKVNLNSAFFPHSCSFILFLIILTRSSALPMDPATFGLCLKPNPKSRSQDNNGQADCANHCRMSAQTG